MTKRQAYWNLYWVESDGYEDCFVVARNSRSACAVECEMNGFESRDVVATKILRVPNRAVIAYKRSADYKERQWPWYVYGKKFFQDVGAEFRTVEGQGEMLLHDVVYEVDDYRPCDIRRSREIGRQALDELDELDEFGHDDEDVWPGPEIHLVTAIGMCLVRCQQIENYIAESFLLGISKKQKSQYLTINDLKKGWKKKTFGNMLRCIEEAWEIEPVVNASFQLFLQSRNALVHGLTTSEKFDIRTHWGRKNSGCF